MSDLLDFFKALFVEGLAQAVDALVEILEVALEEGVKLRGDIPFRAEGVGIVGGHP